MWRKVVNITTDSEEILYVWAELQERGSEELKYKVSDDTELPSIAVSEVEMAVKQMKDNKAPCNDDLKWNFQNRRSWD